MAIIVPDQGTVDLSPQRGSRIIPVDTYAPPPTPQRSTGAAQLAEALSSLGGSLMGLGSQQKAEQEKLDLQRIDYYKSQLQTDFQAGGPQLAQQNPLFAERSPMVQAKVMESFGYDQAILDAQKFHEQLYADPNGKLDGEYIKQKMAEKEAEIAEQIKKTGNLSYGAGYFSTFKQLNQKFANADASERAKLIQERQELQMGREAAFGYERMREQTGGGYQTVADAPPGKYTNLKTVLASGNDQHILGLKGQFADRLEQMIADAPPEVKAELKVISGYRSTTRQAELYQQALEKYGSPEAARKWVAPPGASNHNHGEAVDFGGGAAFKNTAAGKWVHANAEKYGLYFPMGNEPWHIEMRGGRREGGAPVHRHDGPPDSGNPVGNVVRKFMQAESSGNPNAKAGTSSAAGLFGYTEGTWVDSVKRHRPDLALGKSDMEIAQMRSGVTTAALQQEIATKDVEGYARKLRENGLPVTEGTLYMMHFAGVGGAPKVLKANEGTKVSDLLSAEAIKANPFLANMTAGQMRQWAEEKMGNAVSPTAQARNYFRGVDQQAGATTGLNGERRRQVISGYLYDLAVKTQDVSHLDSMPPELMTPEVAANFQVARRKIEEAQHQRAVWERQRKAEEDSAVTQEMTTKAYEKLAKGEDINPAQAALDPRTGRLNPDVFDKLTKARESIMKDPDGYKSGFTSRKLTSQLEEAYASGKWQTMFPHVAEGKDPTKAELMDMIDKHPDLHPKDKLAMMDKLEDVSQKFTLLRAPQYQEAYGRLVAPDVVEAQKNVFVQMGNKLTPEGLRLQSTVREAYEWQLRQLFRAHLAETNEAPRGNAELQIIQNATQYAKQVLQMELVKATDPKKASQPLAPPPIPQGGVTVIKGADGTNVIVPLAPGGQPAQTPAPASAPAPAVAPPAPAVAPPVVQQSVAPPQPQGQGIIDTVINFLRNTEGMGMKNLKEQELRKQLERTVSPN